jgi:hypothetical protein
VSRAGGQGRATVDAINDHVRLNHGHPRCAPDDLLPDVASAAKRIAGWAELPSRKEHLV